MIDEHGVALLADFQQFYGLNLQSWWTGELGTRRALILAEQLVAIPDSRFRAARRGEEVSVWHWPHVQETIADLYDLFVKVLAGLGGNAAPEDALYGRPRLTAPETHVPTIAEWDVAGFMRQINS
ncbi:hypothetical protein LLS1_18470 [Leifsonia sp. LS1]|uniref:hypothetical protein n=1 Tax=Leifsonia sp. LS1 TaxID=2828483 RepID=UPI001CFE97B8|nr:hypothetical protein [Leifsonia sp. LS1]GIT80178.1 hypothetical protein LLS1_18470 [Leifsonia sp. LS1]